MSKHTRGPWEPETAPRVDGLTPSHITQVYAEFAPPGAKLVAECWAPSAETSRAISARAFNQS
jgi:hypothetical protein